MPRLKRLKHTPHPWRVEVDEAELVARIVGADGRVIAVVTLTPATKRRDLADAALLAIGPEAVDALKLAVDLGLSGRSGPEERMRRTTAIRAVIWKAGGGGRT